jgi:hypothetical protein
MLTAPDLIAATTADSSGIVVTFDVTALDDVDGATAVTCVPASGTKFAVGVTTVTCSSTVAAGNTGIDSFNVTVTYTPPAHRTVTSTASATWTMAASIITSCPRLRGGQSRLRAIRVLDARSADERA